MNAKAKKDVFREYRKKWLREDDFAPHDSKLHFSLLSVGANAIKKENEEKLRDENARLSLFMFMFLKQLSEDSFNNSSQFLLSPLLGSPHCGDNDFVMFVSVSMFFVCATFGNVFFDFVFFLSVVGLGHGRTRTGTKLSPGVGNWMP